MKNVMKTILRNTKLVMILAFLPALFSAAQAQAVDYKRTYKGVRYEQPRQHVEYKVATTATAPTMGFQSTSAYAAPEWAEQPMLNSDGTVNEGAYMSSASNAPSGPRRVGGTPGQGEVKQPLGDAVLPLLFMSLAFCGYLYLRRKRSEA